MSNSTCTSSYLEPLLILTFAFLLRRLQSWFFFSLFLTNWFSSCAGIHVPCCWAEFLTEKKPSQHLTIKGKRQSGISLHKAIVNLAFLPVDFFLTGWTHEHLPPRCRDTVCFSLVIVGYWAKPCLMRRSTVDKPRLTYSWFCRHLPRFTNVFTRVKISLQ